MERRIYRIMKFEEIIPALRAGKKVKQKHWKDVYLHINSSGLCELSGRNADHTLLYCKISSLLENDDWEIIEDKNIVKLRDLTYEDYKKFIDNSCKNLVSDDKCKDCAFQNVHCYYFDKNCWINHKSLYSANFLNQEIEIEED